LTASPTFDELAKYRSVDEPDWRDLAECRGLDDAIFFPFSEDPLASKPAKRVCQVCPVQYHCLAFALESAQPSGIWGGLSTGERRKLLLRLLKHGWSRSRLPGLPLLSRLRQDA